jgi:hypothetical protein
MTCGKLLLTLLFAAITAGCQTTGGPAPEKAAVLLQAGFKAEDAGAFNRNLDADDIRTTALYICAEPRCGGLALVAYGIDPEGAATVKELNDLIRLPRAQALRTGNRILRSAGVSGLGLLDYQATRRPDGAQVYRLDFVGRFGSERLKIRMTGVYRGTSNRLVVAISSNPAVVKRFGGVDMLE